MAQSTTVADNKKTNPFSQRRQTASQKFTYQEDKDGNIAKENESESDDFDEFYNDKSFLNTGMGTGMNNMGKQGG